MTSNTVNTSKKYELTDEVHPTNERLRRIRALRDIPAIGVRQGDLGGWVERSENLSHKGTCWAFNNAQVSGAVWAAGNARVFGDARVFGEEILHDDFIS